MTARREQPESGEATRYDKGHRFEEQVVRWVRRRFSELTPEVATNHYANGLSVKRPYQIDVHVHTKGKGLFGQDANVWIECKWKGKSSVKRIDIMKLVASAQDVYQAAQVGRNEIYYNGLMVVYNQRFDSDALSYAGQQDVLCIRFDGKKYEQQNDTEKWIGQPAWLKQIS